MIRVGSGYDVHRFGDGDHVMLGGIRVPHTHGVIAHSDGDVLLHALIDALLGSVALGDLGLHFSDTDVQWKNAASSDLLQQVIQQVTALGYQVINVDLTLIAEAPKLKNYREAIRQSIATLLTLPGIMVSVKATTVEGLGVLGAGKGLAAQAVVLVERQ